MLHAIDFDAVRSDVNGIIEGINKTFKGDNKMALPEPQKTQSQLDEERRQEEEQAERAKKNNDFVQFSRKNMLAIAELIRDNNTAAQIFMFLTKFTDRYNAIVCSSAILEEYTGASRSTVSRAIKHLKNKDFITVGKSGTTNVYILNPHVVWSSWRNAKEYCEFSGGILLSRSENADLEEKLKSKMTKVLGKNEVKVEE